MRCLTISVILLSGCHYTPSVQEAMCLSSEIKPVSVRLGPRFAQRVDRGSYLSHSVTFPTGQAASHIFTGTTTCPWQIELVSAHLKMEAQDQFIPPVARQIATYHLTCILKGPGRVTPLSATGIGDAELDFGAAVSRAVMDALTNVGEQARACIE